MTKIRTCVFPAAIRSGLLMVFLFTLTKATEVNLLAQEVPPQSADQRQAREALDKGVQDFKNGQYEQATQSFLRAKQLDPKLVNARLYLATTYASQYIPGAPGEENLRIGQRAVEEFKGLLEMDPQNISALDGVGSLLFQMAGQPYDAAKFTEAKSQFQKHIQLKPNDPEPYYWVGVIDWTLSFHAKMELRAHYNEQVRGKELDDAEPLPPDLRAQYDQEFGPTIDEGIESMGKAISLRPDYDDAMAYLNLLYRRKADIVASEAEREELIKMADDLVDQVKDIKQKRAEASSQP